MKLLNLQHSIRLTFARDAEPDSPIVLDKETTGKLDQVPKLLRALAACYGSRLGTPKMWCGEVYLEICTDTEMFDLTGTMIADLAVTAQQLHENAQRQPPLPLAQAVTHFHCIDLLRALAKTYDKSRLAASIHVAGTTLDLPHIALSDFTEPESPNDSQKHLRVKVIGLCVPTPEFNAVVLGDLTILELPIVEYPIDLDELYVRVVKCSAIFIGSADPVRKNVFRALAGGTLEAQSKF